jgi:hypothetical protein
VEEDNMTQATNRGMRFSWKALILAPLIVPFVYGALLTIFSPGAGPFFSLLFFAALGCVLSYGVMLVLFLPCLIVLSRVVTLTAGLTGLLGTALGLFVYGPVIWVNYRSSGDDSGPPVITFGEYLYRHAFDSDFWPLVIAGLVWFLARPARRLSPVT